MDLVQLKADMKRYAESIGLDLVGVAPSHPFVPEKERLEQREAKGWGPNPFEHQDYALRTDPERWLPGVQSIIAAGISYLMEDEPPPDTDGPALRGWLSRYCRGQDYHNVLHERVKKLAAWLDEHVPGSRTVVYVDTGPPLDRAIAERAGIGKFGKHTNLITKGHGTWVFLGEILTDVPLPPDEPIEAACGSCTLCIDACPTSCITEWHLDANRCLSYVTQMKGVIPEEFREVMGNRLFGCDDCQDVCPYNKKATRGRHPEFAPIAEIGAEPDLLQVMAMTKGEFKRHWQQTAAAWRGKTTIQRNAVIALGNSGKPDALPPLLQALGSDSPVIRAHAAWAVGRIGRKCPSVQAEALQALAQQAERETDATVVVELASALESLTVAKT